MKVDHLIISSVLLSCDIVLRKFFGRGLALILTVPGFMAFIVTKKIYSKKILLISSLNILQPIIFIKEFFLTQYKSSELQRYFSTALAIYLVFSFLFVWMYGWGYEKNFKVIKWKIFLGIEGDPNYSSAAILMCTLYFYKIKKLKMTTLVLINLLFFILLFSRTAIFSMLGFVVSFNILSKFSEEKIKLGFLLLIFLIAAVPNLLLLLDPISLSTLNLLTSGRVGLWHFLITGEAQLVSVTYYEGKQAHNALFQMYQYYGPVIGPLIFVIIHFLIIKISKKQALCVLMLPLLLIELFMNSFSALYFLIFLIALISDMYPEKRIFRT